MRLTIDLKATIGDFTDAACLEDLLRYSSLEEIVADPGRKEFQDIQRRLFEAAVSRPKLVSKILVAYAALEVSFDRTLEKLFDIKEDQEILELAIGSLPDSDQKFWEDVIDSGLFAENTEHIWRKFGASIVKATFSDLDTGETMEGNLEALHRGKV